ncbi:DNA circularization protein [Buttiauxella izardii]|uniref:DNA circularization protein n=1 Tax=Buttiauxella izardii TaxID=82991 RepID=A0A3A5JXS5_9ENTR|nr:DNA circularization protein [Buttiauxella izardii]
MAWKDRLQNASFRGVPFKVEEESAVVGRRMETHEFPNRDKPYSEDLGKVTFRPTITAYVIGDDCFDQRDKLIEALNKPGPGALVHPTFGELQVCVDGDIRVSTTNNEGRMVRFDLRFVEAGELSYPTSGAATAQNLTSSCSALNKCISDDFNNFSIDGVADFIQNDVMKSATGMMGYVSDSMKMVDSAVSDAARLMQGDISVLLPPPSSGKTFVDQLQTMWRAGNRLYGNSGDLFAMIKSFSGISLGSDLAPRGVWKTDSATTKTTKEQSNYVASAIRATAISEAANTVVDLPVPGSQMMVGQDTPSGWATVSHPALNDAPQISTPTAVPSWDELVEIRDTLNSALDKEMSRTGNDQIFSALRRVKADLNTDIKQRLKQTEKSATIKLPESLPALVLAAQIYDDANRADELIQRNKIAHPGFIPAQSIRISSLGMQLPPVYFSITEQQIEATASDYLNWAISVEKAAALGF